MDKIGRAINFLNKIPNINSGGCGIVALAMYKYLKKNNLLSKDFRIYFLYKKYSKFLYEVNKRGGGYGANHIVFRFNGKLYDSENLFEIEYTDYVYKHITSIKRLLNALNNDNGWNPMFNREKQIPKIEHRLKIDLSDIKRNNFEF